MDRGAWWAAVRGVTRSQTRLSDFTFTFHFYALEKEMATYSSVLTWDCGASWAAVCGVTQSRTRLSSSSSSSQGKVDKHEYSFIWELNWICIPRKKIPDPNGFGGEFYEIHKEGNNTNSKIILLKNWKGRNTSCLKVLTNILHEHRCKNS